MVYIVKNQRWCGLCFLTHMMWQPSLYGVDTHHQAVLMSRDVLSEGVPYDTEHCLSCGYGPHDTSEYPAWCEANIKVSLV